MREMRAISAVRCVLAVVAVCLGGGAGCYSPTPQPGTPCATNGDCPAGLVCALTNRCERPEGELPDGGLVVDACTTGVCEGDMLVGCSAAPVVCANGCGGPVPHCRELVPSNGLTTALLAGATADMNSDKLNFDATDGSVKRMSVEIRPGGTGVISGIGFEVVQGVGVWTANTWVVPAGESWSFSGTRPVTLYAAVSITIDGTIDVGADILGIAGPGGTGRNGSTTVGGCRGRAGRSLDGTHGEGGGGGGGGSPNASQAGANGAPSNTQTGSFTGIGGSCTTNPSTIPLTGGNGGGNGANSINNGGGGGGGAIALVAMKTITITGDVGAPGGGGETAISANGGGGGGGGGAVLVEAPVVSITGRLTANGGGGGAPNGGTDGARGSTISATPATGGLYSGSGGPARGGSGGAGTSAPTTGAGYNLNVTDPVTGVTTNTNRGGGGGGAAGKIQVKRRTGDVTGLVSPAAAIGDVVIE